MKKFTILLLVIGCGLMTVRAADAGVFIGFGGPVYRPYYAPVYAPPPVAIVPPVVVARPPIVVGPAPVYYGRPYGYYGGYYGPHWHHGRW